VSEYLVISCSLNPDSHSRLLCQAAFRSLSQGNDVEWIDLRDLGLPVCDGDSAYAHPAVEPLATKIANARCILLGTPVYNYDASAAAKNMLELTGRAWTEKVVGFLCAAGGLMSYMSVMSFANSLMLDFRCLIIPRFVYADGNVFGEDGIKDEKVKARIEELVQTANRLTKALSA